MPWKISDVERHRKGLSDKDKRRWVAVANSVLRRCLAEGKSQSTCEGAAIRQANGVVAHRTETLHTYTLTVNTADSRYETFDGKAWLVVPVVPIREAVLNGYLVSAQEIGKYPDAWNGVPLVCGHPRNEWGDHISAQSPLILEHSLGRLFHVQMQGDALIGELWLDIERCQEQDADALECLTRLEQGRALEVSTGFWSDTTQQSGVFKGQSYIGQRVHIRPNHLALLPHDVGACSNAMGCGAFCTNAACSCHCDEEELEMHHATGAEKPNSKLRNALRFLFAYANEDEELPHAEEKTAVEAQAPQALVGNLTHHDLHTALCAALAATMPEETPLYDGGLVDIEAGWVIYHRGEEFYRRPYTVGENQTVALTGEPESVQRVTTYVPTTAAADADEEEAELETEEQQGEVRMLTKQELIGRLVAHERTAWTEEQVPVLQAMEERLLEQMLGEAERRNDQAPLTLDALKTFLKKELDDRDARFDQKLATYTQQAEEKIERTELVAYLQTQGWTEAEAMGLPLTSLQRMRQTLDPVTYAARGAPRLATSVDDHLPSDNPDWS